MHQESTEKKLAERFAEAGLGNKTAAIADENRPPWPPPPGMDSQWLPRGAGKRMRKLRPAQANRSSVAGGDGKEGALRRKTGQEHQLAERSVSNSIFGINMKNSRETNRPGILLGGLTNASKTVGSTPTGLLSRAERKYERKSILAR